MFTLTLLLLLRRFLHLHLKFLHFTFLHLHFIFSHLHIYILYLDILYFYILHFRYILNCNIVVFRHLFLIKYKEMFSLYNHNLVISLIVDFHLVSLMTHCLYLFLSFFSFLFFS